MTSAQWSSYYNDYDLYVHSMPDCAAFGRGGGVEREGCKRLVVLDLGEVEAEAAAVVAEGERLGGGAA